MYRLKSYVELLLLVSLIPVTMPQIKNLSPLRDILNKDLPDSFRTTTAPPSPLQGQQQGAALPDSFSFSPFINSSNLFPPQSQRPPVVASFSGSFGGNAGFSAIGGSAGASSGASAGASSVFRPGNAGFSAIGGSAGSTAGASSAFRPGNAGFSAIGGSAGASAASGSVGASAASGAIGGSVASSAGGGFSGGSFEDAGELEAISLAHFTFRLPKAATVRESIFMGRPMEGASIHVVEMNDLNRAECLMMLPNIPMEENRCPKNSCTRIVGLHCKPNAPYRTINGSCNNLGNPEWGTSIRRFNRYLQPEYEDCISKMRGEGRAINPLPSARTVSAGLQRISQKPPREDLTMLVMQWGQFLDHDLTHTPETPRRPNFPCDDNPPRPIPCCENGNSSSSIYDNCDPGSDKCSCRPIDVSNDQLFSAEGRQCMRFVRSEVASNGCSLGPREQVNQVTSYLDASQVYGSDNEEAEGLRSWLGGLLLDSQPPSVDHGTFLPRVNCRDKPNNEQKCFEAGDVRVNEQPALTSMHTLWLRVHNNIARDLTSLNPSWNDQRLYQETRRIVAALHQQITYREFLPIVHGPDSIRDFQLNLQNQGYDNSYNPSVDATIVNVFATAAFRYGHTLIAESFKGMGRNVTLVGNFDDPWVLNEPSASPSALLQGLTACPTRGAEAFLTPTLVNHLFSKNKETLGFDLMSLNIQRGRDHGIRPYHEWRRACGLSQIHSFEDLYSIMDKEAANVFQQSYKLVKDIDLFPAALAENTLPGGLLGPTFSCLLSQQFQAIKIGDRFWYENQNQPNPFTPGQLSALREQSLASIMCQHLGLDSLQPMVFRSKRLHGNQLKNCSAFSRLNLRSWSPNRLCYGVGVWQQLPGMDQWCINNCLHSGAPYCPQSHCICTS